MTCSGKQPAEEAQVKFSALGPHLFSINDLQSSSRKPLGYVASVEPSVIKRASELHDFGVRIHDHTQWRDSSRASTLCVDIQREACSPVLVYGLSSVFLVFVVALEDRVPTKADLQRQCLSQP